VTPQELRQRTWEFALAARRFCRPLLHDIEAADAARQLTRASASVASNYRAVCLARSRAEFAAKLGAVLEEADECLFWTEYLRHGGISARELDELVQEAGNHSITQSLNS